MCQAAKFNANPGPDHWMAVSRITRYLKFTAPMGIVYKYSLSNVVENGADIFTKPLSFKEFTTLPAAILSFVT